MGRVVRVEDGLQPCRGFRAELVAGTWQKPAVRPRRVDLHKASAPLLMLHPPADVGEHLVPEHHEVEVVMPTSTNPPSSVT